MALDAKIKAKWLKALRSGKYRQGQGALKTVSEEGTRSYCCLGVLAHACKLGKFDKAKGRDWPQELECNFGIEGESASALPTTVAVRIGLDVEQMSTLMDMNDGLEVGHAVKPKTFKQIAKYIEANL